MSNHPDSCPVDWSRCSGKKDSKVLVLILHGMSTKQGTVEGLANAVLKEIGECRLLVPGLPFSWTQRFDLKELAQKILVRLNDENASQYERVIIVGHSAGGVLAQAVYILSRRPEINQLSLSSVHYVLIAPISRGWSLTHHLPFQQKIAWTLGLGLLPLIGLQKWVKGLFTNCEYHLPWVLQTRKSSKFMVWMRSEWISLQNDSTGKMPTVVMLLGSIDELVSWNDMTDPAVGESFVYYEVPHSNHLTVIDYTDKHYGEIRERILKTALGDFKIAQRSEFSIRPWDVDLAPTDKLVKRVVFVIHGIRDEGHWTQKVASRARRHYASQKGCTQNEVAVITSSYGYFSMLQFLMYFQRRRKVDWLVEQYLEARRRYPNAKFSYIGHSNGTYLAAHALERFSSIKFDRIVFAGSVVSAKFNWSKFTPDRVGHVLNYAATADWVVGIFPRIADFLPVLNSKWLLGPGLGGAGIEPFRDKNQYVQTLHYCVGQHGAAIEESNWDHLAKFAVIDSESFVFPLPEPITSNVVYEKKRFWLFRKNFGRWTSMLAWCFLIWLAIYYLPSFAWNQTISFWVIPLVLFLIVALAIGLTGWQSHSRPLKNRQENDRKVLLRLLVFFAVALCFIAYQFPVFEWLTQKNTTMKDDKRMLSLVFYFILLYVGLTRL